ncbi:hypothetical protein FTS_1344 [Francisella tularensis subsp. holarctica FSC200]|nr:hypothetical protein FTA_1458 [Francisella tularensis subsp. holarctica FTNF002-00]AFT93064.1 hypothetical protein FTS_1344 [Francisella tularensis subsp. holarctica FSC200]
MYLSDYEFFLFRFRRVVGNKFAKLNKLDFFYAQKLVIIKTIF